MNSPLARVCRSRIDGFTQAEVSGKARLVANAAALELSGAYEVGRQWGASLPSGWRQELIVAMATADAEARSDEVIAPAVAQA